MAIFHLVTALVAPTVYSVLPNAENEGYFDQTGSLKQCLDTTKKIPRKWQTDTDWERLWRNLQYSSPTWELAMDQIVGLDVVLANGTAVYATSKMYPDVYYTQASPSAVVNFRVDTSDATQSTDSNIYDGEGLCSEQELQGRRQEACSLKDFGSRIKSAMLKGLPNPTIDARELDWLPSVKDLNDGDPIGIPYYGPFEFLCQESWVAQHYGWADIDANFPDQGVDYNNGLNNALASGVGTSYTSHEGYIGPKLAAEEAHSQYYGPIVYSKVKSIKTKVDTYDLFSSSFSI
ncbi:hypothetical protein SCUP515_09419 [Seiridium cupressi]